MRGYSNKEVKGSPTGNRRKKSVIAGIMWKSSVLEYPKADPATMTVARM